MTEPKNKQLVTVTKELYKAVAIVLADAHITADNEIVRNSKRLFKLQDEILKQDNTPENRKYVERMFEAARLKAWGGVEDPEALSDAEIDEELEATKKEAERFEAALYGTDPEAEEFYFGSGSDLPE